ncbi:heavy metal translocating P-type ATPase [Acidaminobacter hydrogenoformans]|uniref:Cd(2+)-exporting ATPase n=1 Tax=Acidaminobacter hydrogenoformans DSM 2784 TaxID=1120920 RepID=A0A1G5S5M6_9FIRM|nr:heavy metal translocating P-type ATPase [Acidaminobacter hydrogenoformans]SCZ81613.1 Cd2+/Zn2+-exporting ATPase [Acidaminobacter hydrogenoformans DSM 2784]
MSISQTTLENKAQKYQYELTGLNCASCAAKIETAVNALPEVEIATLRFATKKLIIKTSEGVAATAPELMTDKISEVVHRYEPHVGVRDLSKAQAQDQENSDHSHGHSHGGNTEKREKAELLIGALLYFGAMLGSLAGFLPEPVKIGIYLVAYILVGRGVLLGAYRNIRQGNWFEEKFLMSVATFSAWGIGEYPEAVAVMLFYRVGELFEDYAVNKSRRSIAGLMDIKVEKTHWIVEAQSQASEQAPALGVTGEPFGQPLTQPFVPQIKATTQEEIRDIDTEFVKSGSLILVKPGERIPLDGVVESGTAVLDTSAITGESLPVEAAPGSTVYGGSINKTGVLRIRTTADYESSTIGRILELIESAADKKASTERFITRFAKVYTPAVVLIAALIAIIPPLVTGDSWTTWLYRASIFLVVSCPCALVISVPLGYFGGIGRASSRGILIKGGNYLEALVGADTVFLDKTGTITEGSFKVAKIHGQTREAAILEGAAALEHLSNHPIARAITEAAEERGIAFGMIEDYEELPGRGVRATYDGRLWHVGSSRLLEDQNITPGISGGQLTRVHVTVDGAWLGAIDVSDQIKESSAKAVAAMRREGVNQVVMLTGDRREIAEVIGKEAGLDQVLSELLPDGKVKAIEDARNRGRKVVFVGDGLNDAPALAIADVGIAMGGLGADLSIEAADIVIMNDDLEKVAEAIQISKKTNAVVRQNIALALGIKALVLGLGTLGLASMWQAVFADVGVALLAILNSMRVHR